MNKSKTVAREKRGTGSLERIVSLRRYLEANLSHMEKLVTNLKGVRVGRLYWKNGARKIREHLKTVKAIENAAQANDKS